MTATVRKRTRPLQERLRALDKKLYELGIDKRLTDETRKEIHDIRSQIPTALQKGKEVQRVVVRAGDQVIEAVVLVQRHANFPLPGM